MEAESEVYDLHRKPEYTKGGSKHGTNDIKISRNLSNLKKFDSKNSKNFKAYTPVKTIDVDNFMNFDSFGSDQINL
jgi:hypothetical protein